MTPRAWLFARHSLFVETALVLGFYGAYQGARGLASGSRALALRNAHEIMRIERRLHLFVEPNVQRLTTHVPALPGTLGFAYVTLHLLVTGATLVWLYVRRPTSFPAIRTALMVASGLSLIGFLLIPTAPPRFAGVGLSDVVSHRSIDLNHGLVHALYNPYAAMPSMHTAYALIVAAALVRYGGRMSVRAIGALYPAFVLLVIVATGNHFLLDAGAGIGVAALAGAAAHRFQPKTVAPAAIPFEMQRNDRERVPLRQAA